MSQLFILENVEVLSSDFVIFDDLSLILPEGKATFIIGKAGSGKSTLLKTAAGLIVPERGRILFRGKNIARFTHQEELSFRKTCSFVFQDAALWANQTVYQNISLPLALHRPELNKGEIRKCVEEAAARAGYTDFLTYRPAALSSGEQKQVSVARCLVLDPEVFFLDEPTASLDEASVDTVVSLFKAEKEAGKTIIAVSHDPRFIAELADQIVVLDNGKLIGTGSVAAMAPLVGSELARRIKQEQKTLKEEKAKAEIEGESHEV